MLGCYLGKVFFRYIEATALISSNAQSGGLGQFAFYWTGHSLSWFLVRSVVVVMGGGALARLGKVRPTPGDLQVIGGAVFAIGALRVAIQRADFYHLTVPFVALAIIFLFNPRLRLLDIGVIAKRIAIAAICVASVAQVIGHIPLGGWILSSSLKGTRQEIKNRPLVGPFPSPEPSIHSERSYSQRHILELAARFTEPDLVSRPAVFYSSTWDRAMPIGVCPVGYSFYDILYADEMSPLADTAMKMDDLVVVIKDNDYDLLTSGSELIVGDFELSSLRKLALRVSSVHFYQSTLEQQIEFDIWKQHLGSYLVDNFQVLDRIADVVVLEKSVE